MFFLVGVRPLIIGLRKKRAKKKGVEYQPLFPKIVKKVDKVKVKIKKKKNGKVI